jgi:hypothetical protein
MKIIFLYVLLIGSDVLAQSAASSDSLATKSNNSELTQIALGSAQVFGAAAAFVLPIELLMPSFMDSAKVRAGGFWLIPFSFSLGGMLLTTHYFGDLMGGDGQYRITILFSGLSYLAFARGWETQDTRLKKYLQFSAPIVLGGIAGYWISSWLMPEGNVAPYMRGSELGIQMTF